ncbi:hypothetical protein L6R49_13765 [Myxococcota bacterium]|nr:hypothetical protein [Myxococcota bacterium]
MRREHWSESLAPQLRGRPYIVTGDVLAATTGLAMALRGLGVERILCVGVVRGTGPLPEEHGFPQILINTRLPPGFMEVIREGERVLREPPPEVQAEVDRFDPEHEAVVVAPFYATGLPQLNRRVFGARPASWRALEDKVVIDAVLSAAGVRVAPHHIVPVTREALRGAAEALDRGHGTVWAGDAREGFNGGAALTRWVRGEQEAEEAFQTLSKSCDSARVMPFLEGVPCSIHAWVLPDGVWVFRPCEMLVLRRSTAPIFYYAQAATSWDPSPEGREEMRQAARRAGEHLRDTLGYRGVFTLDGVMTRDGFFPTELNPRFGAALLVLGRSLPELPLVLLHFGSIEGLPLDWRGEELERLIVEVADAHRQLSFTAMCPRTITESQSFALVRDPDWRIATEADADLPRSQGMLGPGPTGGYARASLDPAHFPVGPAAGPLVAEAVAVIDAHFELGIGPLTAAQED